MHFYNANAVDVLRGSQKDEQFTDLYSNSLSDIVRLCGNKFRNKYVKHVHPLAQFLYYSLTSLSNYQTIGEEYTGTLRFVRSRNNIPGKWMHILWLLLYIGGDNLFDKSLSHCEKKIKSNKNLTPQARTTLLKWVQFFINNKDLLIRFNQTAFYMNGKYYNISNRLTSIQYVFLRHWMGDESSTKALTMLGRVSLLYLICAIFHKLYDSSCQQLATEPNSEIPHDSSYTSDECFLCAEIKNNPSVLPCGHVFCWKCIFSSIAHGAKCPICREPIHPSRIILLQNY